MCVDHQGGQELELQATQSSHEESEREWTSKAAGSNSGDSSRSGSSGTNFLVGVVSWPLSFLSGWHLWFGRKPRMPFRSSSDHAVPTWKLPLGIIVGSGTDRCPDRDSEAATSDRVAEFLSRRELSRQEWIAAHLQH